MNRRRDRGRGRAALGVSGTLPQTVTRNPLAETGLPGVNSGTALGQAGHRLAGLAGQGRGQSLGHGP